MKTFENQCCDCATPSYPCRGSGCPNRNVPVYLCDLCREQATLYHFDGQELCIACVEDQLELVEGSDDQ